MEWKRHISSALLDELHRLEAGNAHQVSRYNQALAAMARVLQDPDNNIYKKSNLEGHCAADVGQQYRLFFFIEHRLEVVNFVWLNSEDFIHTTDGFKDPCYEQFRKMLREGRVEKYVSVIDLDPVFTKDGDLLSSDYINFKCSYSSDEATSGAFVSIDFDELITMHTRKGERIYTVGFIASSNPDLKNRLLAWMGEEADHTNVHYSYYLSKHENNFEETKQLLLGHGFEVIDSSRDEEILLRKYHET